jgi:alpha-tubulin suppressor-like RCC1 family protein
MRWLPSAWLAFLCLFTLAACSEDDPGSSDLITVVIDAEADLAAELERVEVTTSKMNKAFWLRRPPSGEPTLKLPFSFAIAGTGSGTLRIRGYTGETERAERVIALKSAPRERVALFVRLSDACGVCPERDQLTCGNCGRCVPISVDPGELRTLAEDEDVLASAAPACPDLADAGGLSDAGSDAADLDAGLARTDAGDGSLTEPTQDAGADGSLTEPTQDAGGDAAASGADADTGSDAGTPTVSLQGPTILASGRCKAITVQRESAVDTEVADVSAEAPLSVMSDATCSQALAQLAFASGESAKTLYVTADPLPEGQRTRKARLVVADAELSIEVRRPALAVTAGTHFGCALLDDATVQCWGQGGLGTLARNSTFEARPRRASNVPGISSSAQLITNGETVYLLNQGTLYAWGQNGRGGLGQGTSGDSSFAVVSPKGLEADVTQVTSGYWHACAVMNGDAYCWGWNESRQAGDGVEDPVTIPRKVNGLGSGQVVELAAGDYHSCARLTNGAVKCWGSNQASQLGLAGTTQMSATPVSVTLPGSGVATKLWAELSASCVLVDSKPYCWGYEFGPSPTLLSASLTDVRDVLPALDITCVRASGKAYCKGDNVKGWLGTGSQAGDVGALQPVQVEGKVEDLSVGFYYGAALAAVVDGVVYSWGFDEGPALGLADAAEAELTPEATSLFDGMEVGSMALSSSHGCAIDADTTAASCWGWSRSGQLGHGGYSLSNGLLSEQPVPVLGLNAGVTDLVAGGYHMLAVHNGKAVAWGSNTNGMLGTGLRDTGSSTLVSVSVLPEAGSVSRVAAGDTHSCALVTDAGSEDGLYCWGLDEPIGKGALGDLASHESTEYVSTAAVRVFDGSAQVSDVAARFWSTCAVLDGGVMCWGELGDSPVPVSVPGLAPEDGRDVVDVELGAHYGCARTSAGEVYCFTSNGSASKLSLGEILELKVGDGFACAREKTGGVACWNAAGATDGNALGQLGQGDKLARYTPTAVSGLKSPVSQLALGGGSACAKDAQGWKCWGDQRMHTGGLTPWVVPTPTPLASFEND